MSEAKKPKEDTTTGRIVAFGMVGIVLMLILPLPPFLLDMLLTVSVTLGLLIFLMAINFSEPLQFSSFPSVLLVSTMLRLGLNIASTRLILLHGHEGPDAAGHVIQAFGAFVVGGNYLVGVVIFIILIIINFKVITNGAGRIAEVAARFTLDAMPGKQMAIDNELAGGHITEEVARKRRKAVADEADFYGAMDGANKFVKGDAVAGLIVTGINIVGGILIAVTQQGMGIADAVETYTILTVGDGLVSQVPALLVSVAAGLMATRGTSGEDLGSTLASQFLDEPQPLFVAGIALGAMAIVPGMPTFAFLALGGVCLAMSRRAATKIKRAEVAPEAKGAERKDGGGEPPLHDLLGVDLLALEVGFDLVQLVDRKRGGELIKRISGIRKQLVPELGIVVPPIHIRDNLRLESSKYRLLLSGNKIGEGVLRIGRLMAINPGNASGKLKGEAAEDPAFGMPAVWIAAGDRERAELLGYTVVDPATVAATHLTELLKSHAGELLGRMEAQGLVEAFGQTHPKLVEEVIPTLLPLGEVIKVLKNLLGEGISIRDLRTIFEAIADHATTVKDPDQLTELVRVKLARQLTARFLDDAGQVPALVLAPNVETAIRGLSAGPIRNGAAAGGNGNAAQGVGNRPGVDPNLIPKVVAAMENAIANMGPSGAEPLMLTAPDIRRTVAMLAARHAPGLAVLSFSEIDPRVNVKTLGVVKLAA